MTVTLVARGPFNIPPNLQAYVPSPRTLYTSLSSTRKSNSVWTLLRSRPGVWRGLSNLFVGRHCIRLQTPYYPECAERLDPTELVALDAKDCCIVQTRDREDLIMINHSGAGSNERANKTMPEIFASWSELHPHRLVQCHLLTGCQLRQLCKFHALPAAKDMSCGYVGITVIED